MKKIILFLMCIFLFIVTGCSHTETVTSTIKLNDDFSGEHTIVVTVDQSELAEADDPHSVQSQVKELINNQPQDFEFYFDAWADEDKLWYSYTFNFSSLEDYQNKLSKITNEDVEITVSEEGRVISSTLSLDGFVDSGSDFTKWARDIIDEAGIFTNDLSGSAYLESSTLEYKGVNYELDSYFPLEINNVESASKISLETTLKEDRIERDVELVFNTTDTLGESINNGTLINDFTLALERDGIVIDSMEVLENEGIYTLKTKFHILITRDISIDLGDLVASSNSAFELGEYVYVSPIYAEKTQEIIGSNITVDRVTNVGEFKISAIDYSYILDNKQYISVYNDISTEEIKDDINLVNDKEISFNNIILEEDGTYAIQASFDMIEDNRMMEMIMMIASWGLGILVVLLIGFIVFKNKAKIAEASKKAASEIENNIEANNQNDIEIKEAIVDERMHVKDVLNINFLINTIKQRSIQITLVTNVILLIVVLLIMMSMFSHYAADMLGVFSFVADGAEEFLVKAAFSLLTFNEYSLNFNIIIQTINLNLNLFVFIIGLIIYIIPNIIYINRYKKTLTPTELFNNLFINSGILATIIFVFNIIVNFNFDIFGFIKLMLFINITNILFITYSVGDINFNKKYNELISYALNKLRFTFVLGFVFTIIIVIYLIVESSDASIFALLSSLNIFTVITTTIFGAFPLVGMNNEQFTLSGIWQLVTIVLMIINTLYIVYDFRIIKIKFKEFTTMKIVIVIGIVQNIIMVSLMIISGINITLNENIYLIVIPTFTAVIGHAIYAFILANSIVDKYVYGIFSQIDMVLKKYLKLK